MTMGRGFLADLLRQEGSPGLEPSSLSCLQSCSMQGEGISMRHLKPLPSHHISPRTEHGLTQAGETIRSFFRTITASQHCRGGGRDVVLSRQAGMGLEGAPFMNCLYLDWNKITSAQDVSVTVSSSPFTELQKLSLLGKNYFGMFGITTELQLLAAINKAVLTLK